MLFFLFHFINSTVIFEQVVEVLDYGSLCEQVLDIGGAYINGSKCFKVFMIYSCSSVGIYLIFKDGSRIIAVGKIGCLFTCGSYLSICSIECH